MKNRKKKINFSNFRLCNHQFTYNILSILLRIIVAYSLQLMNRLRRHMYFFYLFSLLHLIGTSNMSAEPDEDSNLTEKKTVFEVPVVAKKDVTQKLQIEWTSISWISMIVMIVSVVAFNIHSIFTVPANLYITYKYIPEYILTHYIENPLNDISFNIPIYFDSDMKFPDFPEAVDIQVQSRMHKEFFSLLNYSINMIPGSMDGYFNNQYPVDDLFINCKLDDSNAIQIDGARNFAELYFNLEGIDSNDVPFFMTQLIIDHCYTDEIQKYSPDHFSLIREKKNTSIDPPLLKNNSRFHLKHIDLKSDLFLPDLLKNPFEKKKINITIHVIGGSTFQIEMEQAVDKFLTNTLKEMSEYHIFTVNIVNVDLEDTIIKNMQETDGIFPTELTSLPVIWDLYQDTNLEVKSTDKEFNLNMVFYPYIQGGDFIKQLVVRNLPIYAENENTYLKIDNWGSIYFSHLQYHESYSLEESHLRDCIWSFSESLLDILGVPSTNMAPTVRIKIYKRYMIMQFLSYYSELLNQLRSEIDWNWLNFSKLSKLDSKRVKTLAEAFHKSMKLRQVVAELTKNDDLTTAINISRIMTSTLQNALEN